MPFSRRTLFLLLLLAALLLYLGRTQALLFARLVSGGAVIAYLFLPLSRLLEKQFSLNRTWSIVLSFLAAAACLTLILILFLPPLLTQMRELISSFPSFAESAGRQLHSLNDRLAERGLSRLMVPEINWQQLLPKIPPLLGGTASFAGSLVSRFTEWTLSFLLAYYFLRDRERLALHLELLIPSALRKKALRAVASVRYEIGSFLRGQLIISLIVAALSAIGLMLAGVHSFLPLGLIVGVFNMIPYFGPLLGAIPVLIMALTQGIGTVLLAALTLFTVQQLDSMVISPRIMGALTGLHPGSVLLAITMGSSIGGIAGMLMAIPLTLAVRSIIRVWMAREAVD